MLKRQKLLYRTIFMSFTVKCKHAGQSREVTLQPGDEPYERIASAFGLPVSRIKLIKTGKLLPAPGTTELSLLIRQPGSILVLNSDALPTRSERVLESLRSSARLVWASLTVEGLQYYTTYALTWLWSCIAAGSRGAVAFVTSAIVAPGERREHERQD
jgi:hypothetical protein